MSTPEKTIFQANIYKSERRQRRTTLRNVAGAGAGAAEAVGDDD